MREELGGSAAHGSPGSPCLLAAPQLLSGQWNVSAPNTVVKARGVACSSHSYGQAGWRNQKVGVFSTSFQTAKT